MFLLIKNISAEWRGNVPEHSACGSNWIAGHKKKSEAKHLTGHAPPAAPILAQSLIRGLQKNMLKTLGRQVEGRYTNPATTHLTWKRRGETRGE